ncbi:Receptor-like protein [Zancudomyces culisetae]|uniref:RING-type E3 ubiquitin transferase n=1 Tax=Zancudomyces culisetae TaxID=1213189 RepID=A0A1R1PN96_ZANCU|nr:Receptor-like protein [Zancudomyces culisetae]OMH82866.1 Receptor-like protein [Zancudomyces culisetae]|eukprot:OMH82430.1 Receptor-like protein [Zancudomyces culisetae]
METKTTGFVIILLVLVIGYLIKSKLPSKHNQDAQNEQQTEHSAVAQERPVPGLVPGFHIVEMSRIGDTDEHIESLPKYTPALFSSPQELSRFPIIFWNKLDEHGNNRDGESITCALCTKEIPQGVPIRSIPCSHLFHISCLDSYLLSVAASCPECAVNLHPGLAEPAV